MVLDFTCYLHHTTVLSSSDAFLQHAHPYAPQLLSDSSDVPISKRTTKHVTVVTIGVKLVEVARYGVK